VATRKKNPAWTVPKPVTRRLQVYGVDPSGARTANNQITVSVPWEPLEKGPTGQKIAVIDYDAANQCYYPPVDLEDRYLLSTLTVLNTGDSGAGSLRDTISAAQNGDTIVFAPSLAGQTNARLPTKIATNPQTMRRLVASRKKSHAMTAVKTASRLSSSEAAAASAWASPNINSAGAMMPPKTTAAVSQGMSERASPRENRPRS